MESDRQRRDVLGWFLVRMADNSFVRGKTTRVRPLPGEVLSANLLCTPGVRFGYVVLNDSSKPCNGPCRSGKRQRVLLRKGYGVEVDC